MKPLRELRERDRLRRSGSLDSFSVKSTHRDSSFQDCMQDVILTSGYYKFLQKCFCEESLLCYKAIISFEKVFAQLSPIQQLK